MPFEFGSKKAAMFSNGGHQQTDPWQKGGKKRLQRASGKAQGVKEGMFRLLVHAPKQKVEEKKFTFF